MSPFIPYATQCVKEKTIYNHPSNFNNNNLTSLDH